MNPTLRRLLISAGYAGADTADSWRRMLLLRNYGRLPPSDAQEGSLAARGMKLLLLDDHGRPEFFCRCGWAQDADLIRESVLLEALTSTELGRRHIPHVRSVVDQDIHLQLSRYIRGGAYSKQLVRQGAEAFESAGLEIATIVRELLGAVETVLPPAFPRATTQSRAESIHADLETLARGGVPPRTIRSLENILARVDALPLQLQHGDLWSDNVLVDDGHWWLIDFTECGHVWVPLYDVLHFVSTIDPSRLGLTWLEPGCSPNDPWVLARSRLIWRFADADGLRPDQVGTAIVYYVAHLAAYRLRPGVPRRFSGYLLAELDRLVKFTQADGALEVLLAR